eukprot:135182-Pyramimonas_sp.AAC.1
MVNSEVRSKLSDVVPKILHEHQIAKNENLRRWCKAGRLSGSLPSVSARGCVGQIITTGDWLKRSLPGQVVLPG